MLTIGRLASYAGVTIRAVRHYHQVGLLPEPDRDASGYRTYDAAAVVRLIRIRTLAEAGVPLARVRELLDADPATFAAATTEIDRHLRAQIRALQEHRRRIAQLGSGASLALPPEVSDYLDRLRDIGAPERARRTRTGRLDPDGGTLAGGASRAHGRQGAPSWTTRKWSGSTSSSLDSSTSGRTNSSCKRRPT